ncbi:hypothetical protein MKZ08_08325 [Viridibacillus sp. FSL R5-0477]|uniref:Uncharacterized protein n=1 Tax=Viridibacillus arenosi FSL R5-213 TaxID=1227360 RepID=W4EVU6_9BACL|nr:hypothetical protein [Viridibacillus arenosi]ETT84202.1 hypothetical protein C176_12578 [Viridibacillus arenosi FSL R5-213]OMC90005.1 hypothetical protein BK137_14750 [Viridibacillus arenosi]
MAQVRDLQEAIQSVQEFTDNATEGVKAAIKILENIDFDDSESMEHEVESAIEELNDTLRQME